MARYALSEDELSEALTNLSGWSVVDGKLHKEFKFDSFAEAMGWMVAVGIQADKMNHRDRIRTCDLRVMSPTSCHCSTQENKIKTQIAKIKSALYL